MSTLCKTHCGRGNTVQRSEGAAVLHPSWKSREGEQRAAGTEPWCGHGSCAILSHWYLKAGSMGRVHVQVRKALKHPGRLSQNGTMQSQPFCIWGLTFMDRIPTIACEKYKVSRLHLVYFNVTYKYLIDIWYFVSLTLLSGCIYRLWTWVRLPIKCYGLLNQPSDHRAQFSL